MFNKDISVQYGKSINHHVSNTVRYQSTNTCNNSSEENRYIWFKKEGWLWSYSSWIYKYLCNQCLSPLMLWVRILPRQGLLDTTLYDKVYVLLYYKSKWVQIWTNEVLSVTCYRSVVFSTNKTDRHYRTEILLKMALNNNHSLIH